MTAWMSATTFAWIVAVVLALIAVTLMSLRAGRSTRSVAHVIRDTEDQVDAGRRGA